MDANLTDTSQVLSSSNSPFSGSFVDLVGVNFYYPSGGSNLGSVNGVTFDDISLMSGSIPPPAGPFVLSANVPGHTLSLNLGFTSDNAPRNQNLAAVGADATNLNAVANEIFYVGGANHANPMLTIGGLGANRQVYVQLIGGDQGWNGDLNVTANGADVGADWTTVANTSANTGSLYAFDTMTNGSGDLTLGFNISAGNFAGVSALIISGQPGFAAPPAPAVLQATLVNTNQILGADAQFDEVAAAINFRFSNQPAPAPGTVSGIAFDDVDWLAAEAGPVALSQGGTVMVATSFANSTARARNQNTAATISGADDAVLESIANRIMFLGANDSVTFDLTGLEPSRDVRIQLIGGDEGALLGNWLGDFDVIVNGQSVGLWNFVADDASDTASLATLLGSTDAAGNLQITLNQVNGPPGQFAGVGALIVSTAADQPVPEPATAALLALAGFVLTRRRRPAPGPPT